MLLAAINLFVTFIFNFYKKITVCFEIYLSKLLKGYTIAKEFLYILRLVYIDLGRINCRIVKENRDHDRDHIERLVFNKNDIFMLNEAFF